MTSTLTLNGLTAVSVRLFQPWIGAWTAEVDFDLADVPVMPSGPAILVIGTTTLRGTIDPDASGRYGVKACARVIGGGGGWHKHVASRQFHNDAGVFAAAVVAATAAEVGEVAAVVSIKRHGVDYMRQAGPASRVLAGQDWWVTLAGTTTVGPRPPLPASPDVDILSWEPHEQRAELATDALVMPGTILTDPKFGTATIRDVEQRFDSNGARATAWCGATGATAGRLVNMLTSLVRERGGLGSLKTYRYRVVLEGVDGRLTLQAVSRSSGAPDSIAIPPWYGLPGCNAKALPGMEAVVTFLDSDPGQPVVLGYHGGDELATGVATQLSMTPMMGALFALCTSAQAFLNFPLIAALSGGTAQPLATAFGALAAIISPVALPANFSIRTKAS